MGSISGNSANANYSFKSGDDEIALEVERSKTEILLHLLVKDLSQYDYVAIERSPETPDNFAKCKYISGSDTLSRGSYMLEVDRYPYAACKNVYYRIKTVTRDGIERAYPAVFLPASKK